MSRDFLHQRCPTRSYEGHSPAGFPILPATHLLYPWTSFHGEKSFLSVGRDHLAGLGWTALVYRVFLYLLLFPELNFHLLVPELVFANAVAGDEVAADVSQLWVLFSCLFDKTASNKSQNYAMVLRVCEPRRPHNMNQVSSGLYICVFKMISSRERPTGSGQLLCSASPQR